MNLKMKKLRLLAGAALFSAAALAHADVLDFDAIAPRAIGYSDQIQLNGYTLTGESALFDAMPGDLVGGILNGSKSSECLVLGCPQNPAGNYYAGLNDGVVLMQRADHQVFSLKSLDASWIGETNGDALAPDMPGILRIQGYRSDHTFALYDIELFHHVGKYYFSSFDTGTFGNEQFVAMAFFGMACDYTGTCTAFETNQGQFAIDNLNVSAVPEPSAYAMLGTGFLFMGAIARRRKNQRFATGAELAA
jgi:hypothetical protein